MSIYPLVSIILPVYNAEKFISMTVQSVLLQSYTHWELIIINDGSCDGTRNYLESLCNPAIRVIHQNNMGVSAARNIGLESISGQYIIFLDADDILTPNSLMIRVKFLNENPDVDLVDGWISVRDESLINESILYKPYYRGLLFPRLLRLDSGVFLMPSYMFRMNRLSGTRFNTSMSHSEDILFFLTLASRTKINYDFVSDTVLLYRRPRISAMSSMQGLQNGYILFLKNIVALDGVNYFDHLYLRFRISRILFLSWLSKGNLKMAFQSVFICINSKWS
jgi:glycosyltransferase involved in cell wall biosynthesis